jgi:hypothetical protein
MKETHTYILNSLNDIISEKLRQIASESKGPDHDPDRSDEFLKDTKNEVKHLQRIRGELELLLNGMGWNMDYLKDDAVVKTKYGVCPGCGLDKEAIKYE